MNTSLSRVVESALPALSGLGLTYNSQKNIYLTDGYTSAAGNTYYQGIRLSDRIIVVANIGQGYAYTFLNGISIYGFNGQEKKLIGSRSFYNNCYSEYNVKENAKEIVMEYMISQAKMLGAQLNARQLDDFSRQLVDETYKQTKLLK